MGISTLYIFLKRAVTVAFCLSFFSCNFSSDTAQTANTFAPHFALYLLNKESPVDFLLTDRLDTASIQQQTSVPAPNFNREYIAKGKSLFLLNYDTQNFICYQLDADNRFVAQDSVYLGETGDVENYHWQANTDTLLLLTVKREKNSTAYLHTINTKTMSLISKKTLPLPAHVGDFNLLNIGLTDLTDGLLWLGYSYSKYLPDGGYTTADTMFFSNIKIQELSVQNTQRDTRSSYPGGINTVQSYAAKNEIGDLYFMSCPGIALGNTIDAPTAIFRKRRGASHIDPDYMVNISAQIKNHAYGFWYIGKQKAIIRAERKDRYTDFSNHHSTYQFEYYVVNLDTGNLRKLDLPFDKGTRKENVLVDGNLVYIGTDDQENNHIIWEYNSETQHLKKSINLSKSIDFILRIDRI